MRPRWVNVCLFMVTQRPCIAFALTLWVAGCWWFATDYYMVRLKWLGSRWLESYEWIVPTVAAGAFLAPTGWLTALQIRRGLPEGDPEAPIVPYDAFPGMLVLMAPNCTGLTRRYVNWLQANRIGWSAWAAGTWFFLLLVFLSSPPLHSEVVEHLASFMRKVPSFPCCLASEDFRAPDEIFNLRNRVADVETRRSVPYRLVPDASAKVWRLPPAARAELAVKEQGTLLIYAGDFPHVHRLINVRCSPPDCAFPGLGSEVERTLSIRAGEAEFDFLQSPRGTHLNVILRLLTQFKRRLDRVVVEPKEDQTK